MTSIKLFSDGEFEGLKRRLTKKGKLRCTVVSGSMRPLILIGGRIEVAPLSGVPRVFDIVVFLSAGQLICHYVFHVNRLKEADPIVVTRGLDSTVHEDFPIRTSAILGRVVSHRIPLLSKIEILIAGLVRWIRRR